MGVGMIFSVPVSCGAAALPVPSPTTPFRRFMSLSVSFSDGIFNYWGLMFI